MVGRRKVPFPARGRGRGEVGEGGVVVGVGRERHGPNLGEGIGRRVSGRESGVVDEGRLH